MLAIALRFPAGRYHATPWGRHVNEADVAWPPDPWRLTRGLIATWYRKLDHDRFPRERLANLLARLTEDLPVYDLPDAVHSHSRHYMPAREGTKDKSTLVFDAFARLPQDADLVIAWPDLELQAGEMELLDTLLERMGYLGRAESWVEGRRLAAWNGKARCLPSDRPAPNGEEQEIVPLFVPRTPADYAAFRTEHTQRLQRQKLKKADRISIETTLPADWLAAVELDTADLRRAGWSQPPAAQTVHYHRPVRSLRPTAAVGAPPAPPARRVTTVRYALYGRPLPRVEDTVRVAEWLRAAVMARARRRLGRDAVPGTLSGHGPDQDERHGHAFFIPEDGDEDGLIDHLLIHATDGFDPLVQQVLSDLQRIRRGEHGARAPGEASADADDRPSRDPREMGWQPLLEAMGGTQHLGADSALLRQSAHWESVTPYLHPWYAKRGFTAADQIRRECALRGLHEVIGIETVPTVRVRGRERYAVHFHRFRSKRGLTQPDARGAFYRLAFAEPVDGPLALGFGCHFGLGLFRPAGG